MLQERWVIICVFATITEIFQSTVIIRIVKIKTSISAALKIHYLKIGLQLIGPKGETFK